MTLAYIKQHHYIFNFTLQEKSNLLNAIWLAKMGWEFEFEFSWAEFLSYLDYHEGSVNVAT